MPQVPLQRWTDVALKREGGNEITRATAPISRSSTRARHRSPSTCASPARRRAGLGRRAKNQISRRRLIISTQGAGLQGREPVLPLAVPRGRPHPAVPLDGQQTRGRQTHGRRPRDVLAPEPQVLPRRGRFLERGQGHRLRVHHPIARPPDLGGLVGAAERQQRAPPRAKQERGPLHR